MHDIESTSNSNFLVNFTLMLIKYFSPNVYLLGSINDKILLGLAWTSLFTLMIKDSNFPSRPKDIPDVSVYYMDDYDKAGGFYIYFIPNNYTGDIKQLNTDKSIKEGGSNNPNFKTPIKLNLFSMISHNLINDMKSSKTINSSDCLTEFSQAFVDYKNDYIKIKEYMQTYVELVIAGIYSFISDPASLSVDSSIINTLYNLNSNRPTGSSILGSPFQSKEILIEIIKMTATGETS
jgi:hypothetical protein